MKILRDNSDRYRIRPFAAAVLAVLGVAVVGGGSAAASASTSGAESAQRSTGSVAVKTRKVAGLGVVLVNAKGRTLYTFAPDQRRHVTCTGQCAKYWPPLKWKSASKPTAGGSAKTRLLGVDSDPAGGRVVTYSKWPLYTYLGDGAAGQANGQATNQSGGKWYVISPTGKVIKHT